MRGFKMHMDAVANHLSIQLIQIQRRSENPRIAVMERTHAVAAVSNPGGSPVHSFLDLIKAGAAVSAGNPDAVRDRGFDKRVILIKFNRACDGQNMTSR